MPSAWQPTRRLALLGGLAGASCATFTPGALPADEVFRNIATPSESVHAGVVSQDGQQRLTVRLCLAFYDARPEKRATCALGGRRRKLKA